MHVKWDGQLLHNGLSLAFEFKQIWKNIPGSFSVDLNTKREPRMTAAMNTVVSKLIGMMNLFL
jgi:hypothetical protein